MRHTVDFTKRKRKRMPLLPGSSEVTRLRAELSRLGTAEEIAAWYDAHPELGEVQVDWFHACLIHARFQRIGGLEQYCRDAWEATWRTPLSHGRYLYWAHGPHHAERRRLALERMLDEAFFDPNLSTRATIDSALCLAEDVINRACRVSQRASAPPRPAESIEQDAAPPRRKGSPAAGPAGDDAPAAAALQLLGHVLRARLLLDAFDRGLVLGARGQLVAPAQSVRR